MDRLKELTMAIWEVLLGTLFGAAIGLVVSIPFGSLILNTLAGFGIENVSMMGLGATGGFLITFFYCSTSEEEEEA